jgi:hypothetical protein
MNIMRSLTAVTIAVLLSASSALAGDREDGLHAYSTQNWPTALRLLRPLAERGDAYVQFTLGSMYEYGYGVPSDYEEAAKWYRRGAEQGNGDAQNKLAGMYWSGTGVPRDIVLAHMWFNLSFAGLPFERTQTSSGKNWTTELRQLLESQMTPAQIAEAQRLAREWKPTK